MPTTVNLLLPHPGIFLLSIYLYLSLYLSIICLSLYMSICLSVCLPPYLYHISVDIFLLVLGRHHLVLSIFIRVLNCGIFYLSWLNEKIRMNK